MKRYITLFMIFCTIPVFSQMKVSDGEPGDRIGDFKTLGTMYSQIDRYGDEAVFTYRDDKFSKIDNYKSFVFNYDDLDMLYDLFTNFKGVSKNDKKTVELDNGDILSITYKKTLGQMYAEVYHHSQGGTVGLIRWMTKKQIKNLFGKK